MLVEHFFAWTTRQLMARPGTGSARALQRHRLASTALALLLVVSLSIHAPAAIRRRLAEPPACDTAQPNAPEALVAIPLDGPRRLQGDGSTSNVGAVVVEEPIVPNEALRPFRDALNAEALPPEEVFELVGTATCEDVRDAIARAYSGMAYEANASNFPYYPRVAMGETADYKTGDPLPLDPTYVSDRHCDPVGPGRRLGAYSCRPNGVMGGVMTSQGGAPSRWVEVNWEPLPEAITGFSPPTSVNTVLQGFEFFLPPFNWTGFYGMTPLHPKVGYDWLPIEFGTQCNLTTDCPDVAGVNLCELSKHQDRDHVLLPGSIWNRSRVWAETFCERSTLILGDKCYGEHTAATRVDPPTRVSET